MSFAIREHDHADVLVIEGRFLGSLERPVMGRTIDTLLATGRIRLVIDLSETVFMDSTGIGLLIHAAARLRAAGGDVRLASMQDRVRRLFITSRLLGEVFADYPATEDALASYELVPAA